MTQAAPPALSAQDAWNTPAHQTLVVLLALAVCIADIPEPLPLWPTAFGAGPSVGTALLLTAVIAAVIGLARLGPSGRGAAAE